MQRRAEVLDDAAPVFSNTSWTVILSCRQNDGQGDSALNQLCSAYWQPVFLLILRRGYSNEDAKDLTQQFFADIVTKTLVHNATANRGRFRSFLGAALRNFLADMHDHTTRIRHGGAATFISLSECTAERSARVRLPPELKSWPDDRVFDWRWAATVAQRAMARLAEECDAENARWIFEGLKPFLGVGSEPPCYDQLCGDLGVPLSLLKRLLHKFRRRFSALLREQIAATVADRSDVEPELRYLLSILGSTPQL